MPWNSCVRSYIMLNLLVCFNVQIFLSFVDGIGLQIKPGPYQDITLVCDIAFDTFKDDRTCQVFWMRDKHAIQFSYCYNASSPYVLAIIDATFQDSGEYYCGVTVASKGVTTLGVFISLTVYKDSPSVTIPNPVYASAYGNNITLECIIMSSPNHTYVYWQHLYNGTFRNITSQSPGVYGAKITEPSLTILRVTPEDSGQYTCNAVNQIGTGRSEPTKLTVLGVPIVKILNAGYNATYGHNITLHCIIVSSQKHRYIYWQHISNSKVINITSETPGIYGATMTEPSLTLLEITTSDAGQYTCFAVNIVGTGQSEPTTLIVLRVVPSVKIPKLVYHKAYGYNITLECIITSFPNPTYVYWQKIYNGTLRIITAETTGVLGSTTSEPSLTILRVVTSDAGQYTCFAVNIFGTGQSEPTTVTVFGGLPSVKIFKEEYECANGYNVSLECIIRSLPNHTNVYWQKIYNSTVRNISSETPGMFGSTVTEPSLTILQATIADAGQYICLAVNYVGTGRSEPTTLIILEEQKFPVVNIISKLYVVMYGRSLTLECSVHTYGQAPVVREIYWQLNHSNVITTIVEETVGISGCSIEVPSLTILKVTTSESGLYTCFARNDIGIGESKPIDVTVIGDVPIVYVGDRNYSIEYGEKVILFCNISSQPSVRQIYWEKVSNGMKHVLNNWTVGIQGVSKEAPSLIIVKSTTADIGTYRCVAINDVGTGKSNITRLEVIGELPIVSVKSNLPPVKYGDQASILCVVKSFPVPTEVYWEKTSYGITKVISKGTFGTYGMTVENPSLILLHATDSDTGLYKCVAVNRLGIGYSSSIALTVIGGLPEVAVPSMTHLTGTGYTITLSCVVNNIYPAVYKVYWQRYLHGSTTIISSTSIGIKGVTVDNPSLIIPSTMESMTGEYTCFAVNYVGTGSSLPAQLTVVKDGVHAPDINSKDARDSEIISGSTTTIIISVVSTGATVALAVIAYCTYKHHKETAMPNLPSVIPTDQSQRQNTYHTKQEQEPKEVKTKERDTEEIKQTLVDNAQDNETTHL